MKKVFAVFVFVVMLAVLPACKQLSAVMGSVSVAEESVAENPAATEAEEPQPAAEAENTPAEEAAEAEAPQEEEVPTETPAPDPTAEATPEPEIVEEVISHEMIPDQARYFGSQVITECNTGYNYASSTVYAIPKACDSWRNNLLERPVSPDLGTFYPYLDILGAIAGNDEQWFFISLTLFDGSNPTDGTPLYYFAEIDSDFNGRGDYLIAAENLTFNMTEWTVTGLRVWKDTNKDVGSFNAVLADKNNAGDGYETLLFDQGKGADPDLAWVRRNPNAGSSVEIAFKKSLLEGKKSFLWWVGAMQGEFNPAAFDLVDGQDETALFGIDTTCGWPLGVDGKGYLKQCYIPEPTPVPTNAPSCIKPPKPSYYCNPWIWNQAKCQWDCYN